jgi:hypothetical protein
VYWVLYSGSNCPVRRRRRRRRRVQSLGFLGLGFPVSRAHESCLNFVRHHLQTTGSISRSDKHGGSGEGMTVFSRIRLGIL